MIKRIFWIVLDSFGIGAQPDAAAYGDEGSHTLRACLATGLLEIPNLQKLGLFNIEGVSCGKPEPQPLGAFARLCEASAGKDTTTGHWELAGLVSRQPMPTYPNGFPPEIIAAFEKATGRKTLCNLPYSGTQVIREYGQEHERTGALIVYTSADSVFQIAAHEAVVPVETLYQYCEQARALLCGENAVGRVIARPFEGTWPDYRRTARRHDFSLAPPHGTVLDAIKQAGLATIGVGKINDIFAGRGISEFVRTSDNADGMDKTISYAGRDFHGLCFVNLVDFDMLYGHRNDAPGYARALCRTDKRIGELMNLLQKEDVLLLTADHGCDPSTPSTDHSREYVPLLLYGAEIRPGINLGTRSSFADTAATVAELLGVSFTADGAGDTPAQSFAAQILKSSF